MQKIIILPVFNEAKQIEGVLGQLENLADIFIIINDGSTDSSEEKIILWKKNKENVHYHKLVKNSGMARALKKGFSLADQLMQDQKIHPEDLVFTMDADGQHNPEHIPEMVEVMENDGLDILLNRRDFSLYPFHRKLGNRFLSFYASLLGGFRYKDVESGFRVMRARVIPKILKYYIGCRYSNAQEIALISALLNFKINNDFLMRIKLFRNRGPNYFDALIIMTMGTVIFWKINFDKLKKRIKR